MDMVVYIISVLCVAVAILISLWRAALHGEKDAKEKFRALEIENDQIKFKQNISSELDNASDVYLANVLRGKSE